MIVSIVINKIFLYYTKNDIIKTLSNVSFFKYTINRELLNCN